MRLCRFDDNRLGLVEGETVRDVTAALDLLPASRYPLPRHDLLIANLEAVGDRVRAIAPAAPVRPLAGIRLLSPVANPGKLVAAPVNYEQHLTEVRSDPQLHHNNPGHTQTIHTTGVFLKATSSLVGAGEGIAIRTPDRRTDHEVELAVIVGRQADRVPVAEALRYVAGYAIGLDITVRGSEDRSFRKSPDSYSVLGPWLVTADDIGDPQALTLTLAVNGEVRQHSNTSRMILGVAQLIALASSFYTLHPGDVLMTGTPEGVGVIEAGDTLVAAIDRIGEMTVAVRAAVPAARDAAEPASRPA